MNNTYITGSFKVSNSESNDFAKLSGDFNPMHVDEIYSRRLQYGRTVLHGIHHLLRVLEEGFKLVRQEKNCIVNSLSASFHSPVSVNEKIDYEIAFDGHSGMMEINTQCAGKRAMSAELVIGKSRDSIEECAIPDELPKEALPDVQEFPPVSTSGVCKLYYSKNIGSSLFPLLDQRVRKVVISSLLSTTKIVGMHCPGLHSIFSGLDLKFCSQKDSFDLTSIFYELKRVDQRVSLIDIEVTGAFFSGVVRTFFRPPPVDQPSCKWIHAQVENEEFSGQYALIIGGSRGIGETTAKTIAAGGGEVIITYSSGVKDAQRVMSEITESGGKCQIASLNVLDKASSIKSIPAKSFTHLYYFASPKITANSSASWDSSIYEKYLDFYVSAFTRLVEGYVNEDNINIANLTVFYPSTVYIDDTPRGFFEYAAAKMTGEFACKKLGSSMPSLRFVCQRLPKMDTDQTAGLIRNDANSVFDVIIEELKSLKVYTNRK